MEKKLHMLFDFQRFEGNADLASLISEAESRFDSALSDEDLMMVSAAGVPEEEGKSPFDRDENKDKRKLYEKD